VGHEPGSSPRTLRLMELSAKAHLPVERHTHLPDRLRRAIQRAAPFHLAGLGASWQQGRDSSARPIQRLSLLWAVGFLTPA